MLLETRFDGLINDQASGLKLLREGNDFLFPISSISFINIEDNVQH